MLSEPQRGRNSHPQRGTRRQASPRYLGLPDHPPSRPTHINGYTIVYPSGTLLLCRRMLVCGSGSSANFAANSFAHAGTKEKPQPKCYGSICGTTCASTKTECRGIFLMPTKVKLTAVELFAGAGGLGIAISNSGFRPLAVLEKDPYCCQNAYPKQSCWRKIGYWVARRRAHRRTRCPLLRFV